MVTSIKRGVLGVFAAGLLALAGASPALAASPWWHLTFEGRPADVQPGSAEDAVQEVTVSATEGSFRLRSYQIYKEHSAEEEPDYKELFQFDASDQELQEGLERMWGEGAVEVTGGPQGKGEATWTYVIKFVGGRANQPVELMRTENELGSSGNVGITQRSEGRSDGEIVVNASNLGEASAHGENVPVTVADRLPPGLTAIKTEAFRAHGFNNERIYECVQPAGPCSWNKPVAPYQSIEMIVFVDTTASFKAGELNEAIVSGGEASAAVLRRPVSMGGAPTQFGVQKYEIDAEEAGGAPDTQAGSHPFQLTTTLSLNQEPNLLKAPALAKDLNFKLPPGLIGNPTPFPQCSDPDFTTGAPTSHYSGTICPADTAVGVASVKVIYTVFGPEVHTYVVPVFNLKPSVGEPARFGFVALSAKVILNTAVRTGSDYGVTVSARNITQQAILLSSQVTFWGVPGDSDHDSARGWGCIDEGFGASFGDGETVPCAASGEASPPPLLSMPTSCTGPLQSSVQFDSWAQPDELGEAPTSEPMQALDGCNQLPFSPSIGVTPDESTGSTPSGLKVDVHVPQSLILDGTALAESNVKDIRVALPEGLALNPAAADGLDACSNAQIGYEGSRELNPVTEPGVRTAQFSAAEPSCPNASKIANATIKTPLLPNPLTGYVYLAAPQNFRGALPENPFESLVAMYLVAQDPVSGTLVKLPGKVSLSSTGQIVATFENNPQLAFEDAELEFFGGERAPLATPARCGAYTTKATLEPWSGNPASTPTSSFAITSGPNGSPCSSSLPFSPTLASGTTNINAGSFSTLTTTLSREDGQQPIQSVTLHYPPGVSGILAGIPLCGEVEANAGTCGAASEVGETIVSVGLGGDPFSVTGGKVYLTGPYQGAPFGLSIVNPAKAGPFDLQEGRPVVVRAKIEVDPHTAALTVTTDPSGEHAIPTIIDGIPLQIKHVNVNITRNGFTFNPTSCAPMQVTGTVDSAEQASSPVSVPFQVTNCQALKFTPKFAVSTPAKTSKADGAGLTAKLSYPTAVQGTQTNIAKVKVDLPKQLPSRLTTLQKACTNAQFELNPANCPSASKIGYATVTTPLLPVPLTGPAIFVSHGGEAFPSLTMVLQGYGVTIDLVGTTYISHAGITSTTFKTVPDVPFNTFTLTLGQGKYSALAANLPVNDKGSFCGQTLTMPTVFVAQNGTEIHETTPISISGCAKVKALTRAQKLSKALKTCRKSKSRAERAKCEAKARKQYGPAKAKGKKEK